MLIYIIRHGETELNTKGAFQGWIDVPLNEKGVELARITGQRMKGIAFDECFSSPLTRARQTAQILLQESGNAAVPVQFDDRIREIHMGQWEGTRISTAGEDPKSRACRQFLTNAFQFPGFPGGETAQQVSARTQQFLQELIARDADKTVLVATHGVALRAMLNFLYEDPSDFWHGQVPYNCAVNIIEAKNGHARLIADDKIYYDKKDLVDRYKDL